MWESSKTGNEPPADLPVDPKAFWSSKSWRNIEPPDEVEAAPALKRLGPLPFPRGGFPLIGFLATVYEHVSHHARQRGAE